MKGSSECVSLVVRVHICCALIVTEFVLAVKPRIRRKGRRTDAVLGPRCRPTGSMVTYCANEQSPACGRGNCGDHIALLLHDSGANPRGCAQNPCAAEVTCLADGGTMCAARIIKRAVRAPQRMERGLVTCSNPQRLPLTRITPRTLAEPRRWSSKRAAAIPINDWICAEAFPGED